MFAGRRRRRASKEAAAWYARMAEPGSPAEVEEFEAWLARDPLHARSYAEMDALVTAAAAVPRNAGTVRGQEVGLLRPALAFGLAAVALISVAVLWPSASAPAFATISNDGSAIKCVQLKDGTRVWLDVGTRIGVRFSERRREILVREGRVRVLPAADARPLELGSELARIEPGRTRTDVTVAGGRTIFGAIDGPLAIADGASNGKWHPLRLEAGGAIELDSAGVRAASLDRTWVAGRLRFSETPLRSILALANRLGDPDIAAVDGEVAALRVSGVFDLRDTRCLARKLAAALDLDVEEDGSRLILRR